MTLKKGQSNYLGNGYSIENLCEEQPVCAEALDNFEHFDKYCSTERCEECPHKILTSSDDDVAGTVRRGLRVLVRWGGLGE